MGSEWADSELGSFIRLQRGHDLTDSKRKPGNVPVMGSAGQNGFHDTIKAKGPGIVIGRSGASFGKVHYTPNDYWPHNTALYVTDFQGNDELFTYYFLKTIDFSSYNTGSAQPSLNRNHLYSIPVNIPPLPEQKAIAHILGTLDDKIELNRRMNVTLVGMAQALFKSWFVDFDPVIDNALAAGNPIPDELAPRAEVRRQALANGAANREAAKPFPAAFQFTEELGWIPEGWTLQSFESLATLDTESVKPFEQPSTVWEHYSIPSFDSSGMPSWDRGDEIKSNKYRVKPGAILSSKLNPETERTWWPFMLDGETAICSTEFMQFVPKNLAEQAFVYSLIRSAPFQANILERVTGSTGSRQRAQPKEIAKIGVLDCGEPLRAEFAKVALPLFQSVRNNSLRNQTLTKLRDTLLPKLISGELNISADSINPSSKMRLPSKSS